MLKKDTCLRSSPQLVFVEQQGVAVALSSKQIISLYKKSENSNIPFDALKEVYSRGYNESLSEQVAFDRVNSFIAKGAAWDMDKDIVEKRGLWDNIHAKRERIKHGSGEHMRKPGAKGAPTTAALKASQSEEYTGAEKTTTNFVDPASRFTGTTTLTDIYKNMTPGQGKAQTIKRVVKELNVRDAAGKMHHLNKVAIRMADGSIQMKDPGKSGSSGGGGK